VVVVNFRPAHGDDGVGCEVEETKESANSGAGVIKRDQGSSKTAQEGARDRW
jgi:hypothetical protein